MIVRCDVVLTVTQDNLYVLRTFLNILRTSHLARHSGCLYISCGLPQPLQAIANKLRRKDLNRFLPNPFQFVIHQSACLVVRCQVQASPVALPTAQCSQQPQTQNTGGCEISKCSRVHCSRKHVITDRT